MFKTETLLAFVLVAKHGSFTLAAEVNGQTAMAMSKQVSQLELRLNESLFERSTRKVRLTQFGEEFLARAEQILGQHDSLGHWLESRQQTCRGLLRIITPGAQTYDETVFPWLAEFHALYPDIELVFEVQETLLDINRDTYDIYWGVEEYLGEKHPGLKRRSLWQAQFGVFASPDYLRDYGTPQTLDDLQGHKIIAHPHAQPANALVVKKAGDSQQDEMDFIPLQAPIKSVAGHSLLAVQGLGLINALADNHDIKSYLESGRLVPVLEPYWLSSAEIYIYYQQVKLEQPKVRAFIDFFLGKRHEW